MSVRTGGVPGQYGPGLFTPGWWKAATVAVATAGRHGKDARLDITVAGVTTDASSFLTSAGLQREQPLKDITPLGATTKLFQPNGKPESYLDLEGFFSATQDTLAASLQNVSATFTYYPTGRSAGMSYAGTGLLSTREIESPVSGAVGIKGRLTATSITRSTL